MHSYIDGLSLEDIKYINEQAAHHVEKYTGENFNMENIIHREYFEYFKQQVLKAKEQIRNRRYLHLHISCCILI